MSLRSCYKKFGSPKQLIIGGRDITKRKCSATKSCSQLVKDTNSLHLRLIDTFKKIIATRNSSTENVEHIKSISYKSLLERQIKIEEDQRLQAIKEHDDIISNLKQIGRGTSLKSIQSSFIDWYEPLAKYLQEEMISIKNGVPGEDRSVRILIVSFCLMLLPFIV